MTWLKDRWVPITLGALALLMAVSLFRTDLNGFLPVGAFVTSIAALVVAWESYVSTREAARVRFAAAASLLHRLALQALEDFDNRGEGAIAAQAHENNRLPLQQEAIRALVAASEAGGRTAREGALIWATFVSYVDRLTKARNSTEAIQRKVFPGVRADLVALRDLVAAYQRQLVCHAPSHAELQASAIE